MFKVATSRPSCALAGKVPSGCAAAAFAGVRSIAAGLQARTFASDPLAARGSSSAISSSRFGPRASAAAHRPTRSHSSGSDQNGAYSENFAYDTGSSMLVSGGVATIVAALFAYTLVTELANAAEKQFEEAVAGTNELKPGEMKAGKVNNVDVLLVRTGNGDYYALDLKCSHFGAKLNEGVLNGDKVACPWHDAHFDVKTGAVSSGPGLNALQSYPVRVVGDKVLVSVPATPAAKKPKGACLDCDKRTFVIVGTGAAGAVAAEALRQEGFQGNIVMVTREDSLPYDRTGLSKWPDTPKEKMLLRGEDFYKAHDIQVQRGRNVQSIDTTTKTITFSDGQTMRYDSALLATGGRPRDIPVPGKDLDQVLFMRSLEDAQNISKLAKTAKKVVIIGSSFIGMELAAALKKNMKVEDVVVVGMEKVPFERVLGTEVGGVLQKMHEENGVKFRLGRTVKSFNGKGKVESVVLDNGETLPADFVVVGAGIIPNTDLVKGVPFEKDGSILVNSSMKTSADGLFAAGDVARFPYQGENIRVEHWNVAQNQGRAAARAMLGQKVNFNTVPFFWTRSFDVSLQYAGHASSFDDVIVKGDTSKRQFTAYYVRNDKVVAVAAMGRGTSAIAAGQLMSVGKMPSVADIRAGDPDLHAIVKGLNSGIET